MVSEKKGMAALVVFALRHLPVPHCRSGMMRENNSYDAEGFVASLVDPSGWALSSKGVWLWGGRPSLPRDVYMQVFGVVSFGGMTLEFMSRTGYEFVEIADVIASRLGVDASDYGRSGLRPLGVEPVIVQHFAPPRVRPSLYAEELYAKNH